MIIANVAGDPKIGPWIIPQRAQNMITGFYAKQNGLNIGTNIPEPLFSTSLITTCLTRKKTGFDCLILCSIHQLPRQGSGLNAFLDVMGDVVLHFALEGISGCGRDFVIQMAEEAEVFNATDALDVTKYSSYRQLFDDTLGKDHI